MPTPRNPDARPDVWFAQTLEAHRNRQVALPDDKSFLPGLGLFALPTLLCATLLVAARPDDARSQSAGPVAPRAEAPRRNAAGARLVVAQNPESLPEKGPTVEPPVEGTERRPLSYYTQGIRGSMFAPPPPPPPRPAPAPKPKPEVKPPPAPRVDVAPVNPFEDWSYTGTIRMGEETMALLENSKTKEGQYVRAGDRVMGAEVSAVTDQTVTLRSAGKPYTIAKSDNITVTPLDKSAPYLTSGGQPGAPGMPGMPQGGPGNPMPGGMPPTVTPPTGGQVILPNGRVLTPEQAQRRADFLNRRFNGGFNGGGFNFGGGRRGGNNGFQFP